VLAKTPLRRKSARKKKRKDSKNKKRKDLAVLAKTPLLNRFF